MSIELASAAALGPVTTGGVGAIGGGQPGATGATGAQATAFQSALSRAEGGASNPLSGILTAMDQVNAQARSVSAHALSVEQSGGQLTPGEMINLTMKCQEFMFQCQLTSNIANRSSDGVQQLFKQQG